jgi:hypothetical protein
MKKEAWLLQDIDPCISEKAEYAKLSYNETKILLYVTQSMNYCDRFLSMLYTT